MSEILLPGLNDMSAEMNCGLFEESVFYLDIALQIALQIPGTLSRK